MLRRYMYGFLRSITDSYIVIIAVYPQQKLRVQFTRITFYYLTWTRFRDFASGMINIANNIILWNGHGLRLSDNRDVAKYKRKIVVLCCERISNRQHQSHRRAVAAACSKVHRRATWRTSIVVMTDGRYRKNKNITAVVVISRGYGI